MKKCKFKLIWPYKSVMSKFKLLETNWCKGLMNYFKECPGIRLSQTPLYNLLQSSVKVFSKEKSS